MMRALSAAAFLLAAIARGVRLDDDPPLPSLLQDESSPQGKLGRDFSKLQQLPVAKAGASPAAAGLSSSGSWKPDAGLVGIDMDPSAASSEVMDVNAPSAASASSFAEQDTSNAMDDSLAKRRSADSDLGVSGAGSGSLPEDIGSGDPALPARP
eukprot:TRINITY_DN24662_c0_g1_i1.p1 TRINITY_DN24662_c0_g1~~TRINITY_DN24662_c0_g1_i1.p1  ORF type:complete len:154 (-),score=33.67 TRINITY_DN24662_c0_g1_i1:102-563(-)